MQFIHIAIFFFHFLLLLEQIIMPLLALYKTVLLYHSVCRHEVHRPGWVLCAGCRQGCIFFSWVL